MVGGQAPKAIRSVECYDFEEGRWDQIAELPSRRCRAGKQSQWLRLPWVSFPSSLSSAGLCLTVAVLPLISPDSPSHLHTGDTCFEVSAYVPTSGICLNQVKLEKQIAEETGVSQLRTDS